MPFWDGFLLGLAAGIVGDALIGVFLTAPMAVWWFRRKLPELVDEFTSDKETMGLIRQKFVAGFFGGMSGGRMSWSSMLKQAAGAGLQHLINDKLLQLLQKGAAKAAEKAAET